MSVKRVLVTGGSGFIGTHVVNKLVEAGWQVTVPTRRRSRSMHLVLLPGVDVVEANLDSDADLRKLSAGQHAVVNLVGLLHGRSGPPTAYGPDFAKAHIELPKRIADACVAQGGRRMVQISALGVTVDGKRNLPSRYLRSKAACEQSLSSTLGLDLTIMRPSVVFGREDKFLNLFASLLAIAPLMTLPKAGAKFQPVWVEDVAHAVVVALSDPRMIGKTYDLVGPKVYTLLELVQFCGKYSGHNRPLIGLPDWLGRLQATAIEFAPGPTLMSRDNFDSMMIDNVSKSGFSEDFGFSPASLEAIAPTYLMPALRNRQDTLRARAKR